ncbi:substrate-binding domain-containing protein [Cupriavidus basilensis]
MLPPAAWAADIHVLATGALHAAFEKVIPAYEQQSGNHLIIGWGPSYGASPDALPMRIKNGEPMDVCFMIGAALTDQVKQGRFIPESRVDLVASGVGVAVRKGLPKPNIQTVDDPAPNVAGGQVGGIFRRRERHLHHGHAVRASGDCRTDESQRAC